jgi:putative ABC transport system permease protein
VRLALGASRGRLIREALAETVIIAATGGLLSLILTKLLIGLLGGGVNVGNGVVLTGLPRLDLTVLVGAAFATLLALLVSGIAPALQAARVDVRTALASDGSGAATPRWRGRRLLIATQVMVSLVLLALASVCLTEVQKEHRNESGVDLEHLGVVQVDFPMQQVDEVRAHGIVQSVLSTVARRPGVEAVAVSSGLPFGLSTPGGWMKLMETSSQTQVEFVAASPDIHSAPRQAAQPLDTSMARQWVVRPLAEAESTPRRGTRNSNPGWA